MHAPPLFYIHPPHDNHLRILIMAQEIERKFLVCGDYKHWAVQSHRICQGYLCADAERTVRVRIRDREGFLTIKGPSDASGISRFEWEQALPVGEAEALLALSMPGRIEKVRHVVEYGGHRFEVDEFMGENAGLTMAEVELSDAQEAVDLPPFIGTEVTGVARYYNSQLMRRPFARWSEEERSGRPI